MFFFSKMCVSGIDRLVQSFGGPAPTPCLKDVFVSGMPACANKGTTPLRDVGAVMEKIQPAERRRNYQPCSHGNFGCNLVRVATLICNIN